MIYQSSFSYRMLHELSPSSSSCSRVPWFYQKWLHPTSDESFPKRSLTLFLLLLWFTLYPQHLWRIKNNHLLNLVILGWNNLINLVIIFWSIISNSISCSSKNLDREREREREREIEREENIKNLESWKITKTKTFFYFSKESGRAKRVEKSEYHARQPRWRNESKWLIYEDIKKLCGVIGHFQS